MKEKFEVLLKRARENKDKLILIGGAVIGAAVGAAVVAIAARLNAQTEDAVGWEDDDLEEETYEEGEPRED